jgi:hypothetical protein
MRSLNESVRRLEDLASKLNEATDKLNEQIEAFEERLSATRIGLELWLNDESDRIAADALGDWDDGYYVVGWAKIGDAWHLAVRRWRWNNDEGAMTAPTTPQLLTNAPRHVRMRALPLVLYIVERLGNEAERWLEDVEKALNGTPELPTPGDDDIPF